jgi:hypothetical protein
LSLEFNAGASILKANSMTSLLRLAPHVILYMTGNALAEEGQAEPDAAELALKLANPVSSLI